MRPSWDQYFIDLSRMVASRATCPRLSVGCVLTTPDHHVFSTGYNGAQARQPHCTDAGCRLDNGCGRAVHAEKNAVVWALDNCHHLLPGCTAYITHSPCWRCAQMLAVAEVSRVVYHSQYRDTTMFEWLRKVGVKVDHFTE